jgi:septal ring factor EnvC (AmiA/AmiB activator)
VIYSDWLPGLGQLIILDHGSGYISLYGYNDSLKRAVGEQVSAGEVIATTAQTESGNSKMYFEIRDSGRPVDPAIWLAHAH